ncbi:uncharacterized protein C8Q71DRAFT_725381 [Rhodofomes roseus]|uniref:Uncharacterized protein n=1 Tax=Rhodofomes roseus TaxID=34475 RepID=A0ABQ8KAN3_9APHY|nr:uncharacterized protein C8Q71DRAFT_725381 [Rhodofomes roseus]KAH9834204.1 hypothetical protein C8Q71DRAFT_725381 [Rhodofomes roseus]
MPPASSPPSSAALSKKPKKKKNQPEAARPDRDHRPKDPTPPAKRKKTPPPPARTRENDQDTSSDEDAPRPKRKRVRRRESPENEQEDQQQQQEEEPRPDVVEAEEEGEEDEDEDEDEEEAQEPAPAGVSPPRRTPIPIAASAMPQDKYKQYMTEIRVSIGHKPQPLITTRKSTLKTRDCRSVMFTKISVTSICTVLKRIIPELNKSGDDLDTIALFLDKAQCRARTDDISRLRDHVLKYVYESPGIPIPDSSLEKVKRGWHCHATARMLCPRNERDVFDEDPEKYCQDVRNGQRKIDHEDWPTLLYSETEYNPDELDWGLLKSSFLLKCWKAVFLGPRSVMTTAAPGQVNRGGRQTVAKQYNITSVDEYSILYITILARFQLNSVAEWDVNDGVFTGVEFFNNLLSLFEDDEWRKDTLAWWNAQVFGTKTPGMPSSHAIPRAGPSSVSQLKQQRAARRLLASARRRSNPDT